jgi:hypothetical protein
MNPAGVEREMQPIGVAMTSPILATLETGVAIALAQEGETLLGEQDAGGLPVIGLPR